MRRNVESVNARFGQPGGHRGRRLPAGPLGRDRRRRSAPRSPASWPPPSASSARARSPRSGPPSSVDRTEDHYFTAIAGKTAALMATSCRIGALTGGVPRRRGRRPHRLRPLLRHGLPAPRRRPRRHRHRRRAGQARRAGPGRGHLHAARAAGPGRPRRRARAGPLLGQAPRPARAGQGPVHRGRVRGHRRHRRRRPPLRRRGRAAAARLPEPVVGQRPRPSWPTSCSTTCPG